MASALNDNELLTLIKNHIQHMKLVGYEDIGSSSMLKPYQVKIDKDKLNRIKKEIRTCLRLVGPPVQPIIPPEFQNCLVSTCNKDMLLLSLDTMKWTKIENAFKNQVSGQPNSMVYARGNIYVFGGESSSSTRYMRYSLAEKQCYEAEMLGVLGGSEISACYDGNEFIYLVGGDTHHNSLDRVDRFSIDTQQFEKVGHLSIGVTDAFTIFHDDMLYIVGVLDGCSDHYITVYNTEQVLQVRIVDTNKGKAGKVSWPGRL
ncbi:hypothetical protein SAMD00019534_067190 [Acytostelium subglobosum LB1]|uniref:hypothetical protein n=1 Tax=Acytostelium subglobosum LB1 TaxID=1410327 RepID=UPI000644D96A|nr:hypothetical protein SAMD00019534_067190 [Acytostelium subglobosum LB1]GAM23544.1 hypothetical protein SAMD00019534_067190 [Acytostelium subglobosum LB1]|eukprot:XP_012753285.1 hypothetical protein SAMD00019534_067190 [Acytostelium subglobosum LB1]